MPHSHPLKIILANALLLTLVSPMAAQASAALAVEHGCINCHGLYLRDEAPNFERTSSRLAKYKGDAVAEQKFVESFRTGQMFGHIDAHERLSAESAKALIHWLVEGAR